MLNTEELHQARQASNLPLPSTGRSDEPDIWDWVPGFLARLPENLTHGLCPICFRYYYPQGRESC
jgi:hypothetical protein